MSIEIGDGGLGYIYLGDVLIAGGGGGESGGYTPGIYHNSTLGLISLSSDGTNWITIADKNIGASEVDGYGNIFQWGNNYNFPYTGSVTTGIGTVNTSSYGPNNYYNSSTYRKGNGDWSNPTNNDLWGDTTNTSIARKGPCNTGYHIPSIAEISAILDIGTGWSLTTGAWLVSYLKMPYNGLRDNNGSMMFAGSYGFYWTSSPNTSTPANGLFVQYDSSTIEANPLTTGIVKTYGMSIRPFKDEAVVPNDTWTVIYQPN